MFIHVPDGVGLYLKDEVIILQVPVIVIPHAAEHVQPLMAVIPVHSKRQVRTLAHVVTGLGVEAEALTLGPLGLDEDDRFDCGVILGSGIGNQFHALDVLAADLVQFGLVLEFAAVDVDERRALAEDLQSVFLALHAWQILEHGLSGAHLAQQRVLYLGLKAFGGELEGRTLTLDDDFAQHGRLGLQCDDTQVGINGIHYMCLVAQIGDFHDGTGGVTRESEPPIGIGCRS